MDFSYSDRQRGLIDQVRQFMSSEVQPAIATYEQQLAEQRWRLPPVVEELKEKAKARGLWNLFLPPGGEHAGEYAGQGLSNLEYAPLAEEMGRIIWASEVFNCSAPDTGNMEVLHRYGSKRQQQQWLDPLLRGEIRSAFAMTEPDVASSDATNIQTRIECSGAHYVINGHKWWISGVGDPRCRILILMGKTSTTGPEHRQQSQILVPVDTPGIIIKRTLPVMGFDDAPHGHAEILFENVRVPVENILLGEGRGFEIAQGRLGPGRIHHCMRTIGLAEAALEKMVRRLLSRKAFGQTLASQSAWEQRVAEARIDIEMTRLLTLNAADRMDKVGNKEARAEIAMIKVAGPRLALKLIDDAIQAHGAGGLTNDFGLAAMYARVRGLRIADGPDEVHSRTIARIEYRKYATAAGMVTAKA
jgi:acyl-CoA dehydrogenase